MDIFCQIVSKEIEAPIIFEDEKFVVIPSKFPAAETHFLVIPKQHIESIVHAQDSDASIIGEMTILAKKIAAEKNLTDYKLIFNAGKYAAIPHIHLHLLAGNLEDNT